MYSSLRDKKAIALAIIILIQFLLCASVSAQNDRPTDACMLSTNTVLVHYNNATHETVPVENPVADQRGIPNVFEARACICPSQGHEHPIDYCNARYDGCSFSSSDMTIQCFEVPKGKQFMKAVWPIAIVSTVIIAAVLLYLWKIGICNRKHTVESITSGEEEHCEQHLVERTEGNMLELMKMGSFRRAAAFKTWKFQKSINHMRDLESNGIAAPDRAQSRNAGDKGSHGFDTGKGRTICLASDDEITVLESELSVNSTQQADEMSMEAQV